ncbi:DgyrCDS14152 [Dimorphilus gyrociliatus]|uniref:DgyrCDS14152 n=1 Tax=Dimorphilus gyrociliatus TaxID=2664684 RepID=A0A7I8WD08_9ANNE|nr:DgyrCDS14152 [Dimorphilus gyrociliatus]
MKSLLLLFTLSLLCTEISGSCPENFVRFANSCYYFITSRLTWFDADQYCTSLVPKSYNCHLAAIESSAEQDFLKNHILNNSELRSHSFLTSGNNLDSKKGWSWSATNRRFTYANWGPSEPSSGKCVQMHKDDSFRWRSLDCEDEPKMFVCEYEI